MAIKHETQRNDGELASARARRVDPHGMPDVIPMSRVAGGMSHRGRNRLVSVRRMQCHGGEPRNVGYYGTGTGIIGECSSCGTSVYWESRLKIWSI